MTPSVAGGAEASATVSGTASCMSGSPFVSVTGHRADQLGPDGNLARSSQPLPPPPPPPPAAGAPPPPFPRGPLLPHQQPPPPPHAANQMFPPPPAHAAANTAPAAHTEMLLQLATAIATSALTKLMQNAHTKTLVAQTPLLLTWYDSDGTEAPHAPTATPATSEVATCLASERLETRTRSQGQLSSIVYVLQKKHLRPSSSRPFRTHSSLAPRP